MEGVGWVGEALFPFIRIFVWQGRLGGATTLAQE